MEKRTFTYNLFGKIIPERVDFSLPPREFELKVPEFNFECKVSLSIQKSFVSIQLHIDKEITDYSKLRQIVLELVRIHTDAFGYIHGYAYDVDIDEITGENNLPHIIFSVSIDEIEKNSNDRPTQDLFEIAEFAYVGHSPLRIALADFRRGIKYVNDTGMFCYRSTEAIVQHFIQGDQKDSQVRKQGWEDMRNSLNISEDFIREIEKYSIKSRHGKLVPMMDVERINILKRTQSIIDRFFIYLKNSQQPLDKTRFPSL